MLRLLQESCVSKRPIEVIYLADNGSVTQRSIIVNEVNEKAIKACCLLRNAKRVFKLDNILSVAPSHFKNRYLAQ